MASLDTWAVDLADVGAVYPFQGTETLLVVVAVIAWLAWHVVQIRNEQKQHRDEARLHGSVEELDSVVDDELHKY